MKSIYKSKTFWLALLQAVAGGIAILVAQDPALITVGSLAVVKSAIDIMLRLLTETAIA